MCCRSIILGGILGGIILFAWGAISWMVLPLHMQTLHGFKDEGSVIQAIKANSTESGMYFLPLQHDQTQTQVPGPMVFASVTQEGMTTMVPSMVIGFIADVIAAMLVTWMVLQTTGLGYFCRLGFILVFALAGSVLTHFMYWNWFHFATDFTLIEILDVLVAWFLAGLVIAGLTRSKAPRIA